MCSVRSLEEMAKEADQLAKEIKQNIIMLNGILNYRNSVNTQECNKVLKSLSVNH